MTLLGKNFFVLLDYEHGQITDNPTCLLIFAISFCLHVVSTIFLQLCLLEFAPDLMPGSLQPVSDQLVWDPIHPLSLIVLIVQAFSFDTNHTCTCRHTCRLRYACMLPHMQNYHLAPTVASSSVKELDTLTQI